MYIWTPRRTKDIAKLCVSSPVYPVIIDNVRDAGARTSGGNNNDDDNNKGGDMPSWMSKEESNREKLRTETQRRSQPRSRKMITVPLKISKSKKALQKKSVLLDQL